MSVTISSSNMSSTSRLTRRAVVAVAMVLGTAGGIAFFTAEHQSATDLLGIGMNRPQIQAASEISKDFARHDDLIVVINGDEPAQLVSAVETLAREIRSYPDLFQRLFFRCDWDGLRRKGLYQLTPEQLTRLASRVNEWPATLRPLEGRFSIDQWTQASLDALARSATGQPLTQQERTLLYQTSQMLESMNDFLEPGGVYSSPWADAVIEDNLRSIKLPEDYQTLDEGRQIHLRVQAAPGIDPSQAVATLRSVVGRVLAVFADVEFVLAGTAVTDVEAARSTGHGLLWALAISAIFAVALGTIQFRSFVSALPFLAGLMIAAGASLGIVTLIFGASSLVALGVMVLVVALGSRYLLSASSSFTNDRTILGLPLVGTIFVSAGAIILAVLVGTAFADGRVQPLGGAGAGVVGMLALIAAVVVGRAGPHDETQRPNRPGLVHRFPKLAAGLSLILLVGMTAGIARRAPVLTLIAPAEDQQRSAGNLPSTLFASVTANSAAEARRLAREFREQPSVGRVEEIASLIPDDQADKWRIIQELAPIIEFASTLDHGQSEIDPSRFLESVRKLSGWEPTAGAEGVLVQRLGQAAEKVRARIAPLPAAELSRRIGAYQRRWEDDATSLFDRMANLAEPVPVRVSDLPASLVERFYSPAGHWLIDVYPAEPLADVSSLEQFYQEVIGVDAGAVGPAVAVRATLTQFVDRWPIRIGLVLLTVVGLIGLTGRAISSALLALIPPIFGVAAVLGGLGWLDQSITLAHVSALPFVVAIALDRGINVLPSRFPTENVGGIVTPTLITLVFAGSLMLTTDRDLVEFGTALALGTMGCGLAAGMLVPAILFGWIQHGNGHPDESLADRADRNDVIRPAA